MDLRVFFVAGILLAVGAFFIYGLDFSAPHAQTPPEIFVNAQLSKEVFAENEAVELTVNATGQNISKIKVLSEGTFQETPCSGNSCTHTFSLSFPSKGIYFVEAEAIGENFSRKEKVTVRITGSAKTCIDQTPFGECSENLPFYCAQGNLEENCTQCGCPESMECTEKKCIPARAGIEVGGLKESVFAAPKANVSFLVEAKAAGQKILQGASYRMEAQLLSGTKSVVVEKYFSTTKDLKAGDAEEIAINFEGKELASGAYSLVVRIFGNELLSEKKFENALTVREPDSTAPAAPVWAGYALENGNTAIVLNWQPNTEDDLKEYRVYKNTQENSAFITYSVKETVTSGTTSMTVDGLMQGKHFFVLKAVDWFGNESGFSGVLELST